MFEKIFQFLWLFIMKERWKELMQKGKQKCGDNFQ